MASGGRPRGHLILVWGGLSGSALADGLINLWVVGVRIAVTCPMPDGVDRADVVRVACRSAWAGHGDAQSCTGSAWRHPHRDRRRVDGAAGTATILSTPPR